MAGGVAVKTYAAAIEEELVRRRLPFSPIEWLPDPHDTKWTKHPDAHTLTHTAKRHPLVLASGVWLAVHSELELRHGFELILGRAEDGVIRVPSVTRVAGGGGRGARRFRAAVRGGARVAVDIRCWGVPRGG